MTEPKSTKVNATLVAKIIRADGTEETFTSDDITVTDADALAKTLRKTTEAGK